MEKGTENGFYGKHLKNISQNKLLGEKNPMQEGSGTSGLTDLFDSIIGEENFVEKKLIVEKEDGVVIRSRESMHYYEIFKKLFGTPVDKESENNCPYCKHVVEESSKFCRMCGAFPI